MVIDSKYTKTFKSNDLTRQKYDELYAFAVMLRDHKNLVSEYVNSNLENYLEYSKLDFLKEMRTSSFLDAHPDAQYFFVILSEENNYSYSPFQYTASDKYMHNLEHINRSDYNLDVKELYETVFSCDILNNDSDLICVLELLEKNYPFK